MTRLPVLALVTGVGSDFSVVSWAAREAVRRGTLLVVSDLPSSSRVGEKAPVRRGRDLACWATRQEPELEVLVDRSGVPGYRRAVATSGWADLVVIGAEAEAAAERLTMLGSLTDRLVVHAGCPVVVLTPAALRQRGLERNVVLGWAPDRSARYALDVAGAEAVARGARLTVVPTPAPDDEYVDRAPAEPSLVAAVAEVERRHPRLVIDMLRDEGPPVDVLTRAARGADLLVVGCHHSAQRWSSRPGPVASLLMATSPCPLLLVGGGVSRHPDLHYDTSG